MVGTVVLNRLRRLGQRPIRDKPSTRWQANDQLASRTSQTIGTIVLQWLKQLPCRQRGPRLPHAEPPVADPAYPTLRHNAG